MNALSLLCACLCPFSKESVANEKMISKARFVRSEDSYKIRDLVEKAKREMETPLLEPIDSKRCSKKSAVISGAGIAGLVAAFEFIAKGFDVTILEERSEFSRFNIINLNCEVQAFLRKFDLLEDFEEFVAARIQEHQTVVFEEGRLKSKDTSYVSTLQFEGVISNDPREFKRLFAREGVYSVQIKDLQAFLAYEAAKRGVKIISESKVDAIRPLADGRVSKIEVAQKDYLDSPLVLEPDLLVIAEGANSATVQQLGMADEKQDIVENVCSGEDWVFGNLRYTGEKTFVVSMIITAQKTLQIANVIFNAKCQRVNVAVTSDANPSFQDIKSLILSTAKKAFDYAGIKEELQILNVSQRPVHITNRIASLCSLGNIFRIGDAVGHSSPLAGLGGTLGLTLVSCTVEQLINDYEANKETLHGNFLAYSRAYVNKWIEKSENVKKAILGIFEKSQASVKESVRTLEHEEAKYAV